MDTSQNDVAKQSDAVAGMASNWILIDDLMGGTSAMRAAAKRHLPQWPAEDEKAYQARLKTATLFPAYARTIAVLTGKPFGTPITIHDDVPARIQGWLENIDLEGRNLHSFAADLFANALSHGFCGILVDCPHANGVRTVADEKQANIRPYFVHVKNDAILGWRTEKRGGSIVLTQLRLLESVEEPDGPFATKKVSQVRVLEPGRWQTYRQDAHKKWLPYEEGTTSIDVIPFVPVYGLRKDFMVGRPPMLELAHMNVEHWQSKSDQQTILHVARVPMMFARDLGADVQVVVGAGSLIRASSKDADLKYIEHSGAAIAAGRESILDLEDRMRQVGAELLVIKPGHTTRAQTLSDNETSRCDLQRITQTLEDAIDQALALLARFIGEAEGGHVDIYDDFGAATLEEASASLLLDMKADGSLSHATLLDEMKRRGILSADIDTDEEIKQANKDAPVMQREERVNL